MLQNEIMSKPELFVEPDPELPLALLDHTGSSATPSRENMANNMQQISELTGSALEQLALQTLAWFNFKVHSRFV